MKRSNVLAAILGGLMLLAMLPAQAIIVVASPNATLPDGSPGFNLVGTEASLPAVQLPAVQFLIGFNAQHPPSPNTPTLDISDAMNPLINNPDTGLAFSIFWGMRQPGPVGLPAVQFALPMDDFGALYPPSPCTPGITSSTSYCYDFGGSDGTNTFAIHFDITGPSSIDPTSWAMTDAGSPDLPAVQFNFDFVGSTLVADPTLSFAVTENGNPLSFTVPEPATIALFGIGLAGLGFSRRRKRA